MKKHDRDNLKFLMTCPEDDFDSWMNEASDDDVSYALELIRQAKSELMVEEMELHETAIMFDDDVVDAKQIIDRIKNDVGKI
jgi:hypothetical protein